MDLVVGKDEGGVGGGDHRTLSFTLTKLIK